MPAQFQSDHFSATLPQLKTARAGCGCACSTRKGLGLDIALDKAPFIGPIITDMLGKVKGEAGQGAEDAVKPIVTTAVVVSLISVGVAGAALITLLVLNYKNKRK